MRTLKVTSGPAAGETVEIDRELVIGREKCDLTIADPELSRRHAAVRPTDAGVEVEDLGSLNGTFVGGRRLEEPVQLTTSASIRIGESTFDVELELPEVTRKHEVVAGPDVTVSRQVPGLPDPDVTAPRAIPDAPDVTAPRAVPGAAPDVTALRGVPGPPDVTAPRATPPPSPPAAPTGKPPEDGEPAGRRRGLLIGAAVGLVALIVIVVLLTGGGEDTQERDMRVTLQLAPVTQGDARKLNARPTSGSRPIRLTVSGPVSGRPFGTGNATVSVSRTGVRSTNELVLRFDGGTLRASETLRSVKAPRGTSRLEGSGRITDGSGDFDGAKGTFDVTSRRGAREQSESVTLTGMVEY